MPRSRATEMTQRPSPRVPPRNLRTSSSDSDPLQRHPRTDRSPKLSDGRSPRGSQSDPSNNKKFGSRISDLESQLGQAQEELKCLKDQLASAEAAKKSAQEQLDKKQRKVPHSTSLDTQRSNKKVDSCGEYETSDGHVQLETDVFEVSIEKVVMEPKTEQADQDELKFNRPLVELNLLKTMLDERDKEIEVLHQENESIKSRLHEKSLKIKSAELEIEELRLRLTKVDEELKETSKSNLNEKLEATEKAKQELENEMKQLRVQTEQWRKAADAAASVLAGEVDMNDRRISERCGSMDKHYAGSAFEPARFRSYGGCSPDDVFGSGKRKGSGIRMLGDLWKKKGHK